MIIINEKSSVFGDTAIGNCNLPIKLSHILEQFLLYNESKIDKWNMNNNINVGNCDKVVVE